jgi:hypothetical protein
MRIHHTLFAFALIAIPFSLSMGATTSAVRAAAAPCPSGLVWAEEWEGDTRCVTVSERNVNRAKRGLQ